MCCSNLERKKNCDFCGEVKLQTCHCVGSFLCQMGQRSHREWQTRWFWWRQPDNDSCQTLEPSLTQAFNSGASPAHSNVKPKMRFRWDEASDCIRTTGTSFCLQQVDPNSLTFDHCGLSTPGQRLRRRGRGWGNHTARWTSSWAPLLVLSVSCLLYACAVSTGNV